MATAESRIGTEIRVAAVRNGTTLGALAIDAGMTRQTLSTKLNGHSDFTITELRAVAAALGTTAGTLLARAEQAETDTLTPPAPTDAAALAVSALAVSHTLAAGEAEGPSEADLEGHVEACDACTCAEDALEHARQAAGEVA